MARTAGDSLPGPDPFGLDLPVHAPRARRVARHQLRDWMHELDARRRKPRRRPAGAERAGRQLRPARPPARRRHHAGRVGPGRRRPRHRRHRRRRADHPRAVDAGVSDLAGRVWPSSRPWRRAGGSRAPAPGRPCTPGSSPGLTRAGRAQSETLGSRAWARSHATQPFRDAATGSHRADDAVGPRQPCPCGSGRRYKACHGSAAGRRPPSSARPFEGLAARVATWSPCASSSRPRRRRSRSTATRPLGAAVLAAAGRGPRPGPRGRRGLARPPGAARVRRPEPRPRRRAARALEAEPGSLVGLPTLPARAPPAGPGRRRAARGHRAQGFDYWVADLDDPDGSMAAALEQANEAAAPTDRLDRRRRGVLDLRRATGSTSAGCCPTTRTGCSTASPGCTPRRGRAWSTDDRLIGMFRAHGLVAPVWDLPVGTGAEALAGPAAPAGRGLDAAMASTPTPLTSEERSARAGLASRQLTIR